MPRISPCTFLVLLAAILFIALPAQALLNPSEVYCTKMGYQFDRANLADGSQDGYCRMPDHTWVEAWEFLRGRAGQKFNYCALNGYPSKTSVDKQVCHAVSDITCTVCVLPGNREVEVTTLMNLSFAETTCGDGRCVITENSKNCPADCPVSGSDGLCEGRIDLKCDSDCIRGNGDPDCLYLGNPLVPVLALIIIVGVCLGVWFLLRKRKSK
jgi:putative hemolysin